MTPAETRFKAAVRACVRVGLYPGPVKIAFMLGREPRQTIGGRETRWRRAVLRQMGWKERTWPHQRRYSWIPPKSWVPLSKKVFDPKDGYGRG